MILRTNLLSSFKLLVLTGSIMSTTAAYADFNPYTIFNNTNTTGSSSNSTSNTSSNQQANNPATSSAANVPSTNSASAAPSNSAPASNVPSTPFVQPTALTAPGQLVAPATNPAAAKSANSPQNYNVPNYKNFNLNAPPAYGTPTPTSNPTNSGSLSPNGSPTLIPPFIPAPNANVTNDVAVASSTDLITLLNSINHGVASIKGNVNQLTDWQNTRLTNETASGAALVPSTTSNLSDFLFSQTGYSSITNLPQINNSALSLALIQSNGSTLTKSSGKDAYNKISPSALLASPSTQGEFQQASLLIASPEPVGRNQASPDSAVDGAALAASYYSDLIGSLPSTAQSLNLNQGTIFDLISYALNQTAVQTKPSSNADSPTSLFQAAVNAPFISTPDSSGLTWFQQLSTASSPQILRSMAILSATQNQMEYQLLQNSQTQNMMQTGVLTELASIDQNIAQISQSQQQLVQAQQQTNNLLQQLLQQMKANKNGGN